MLSRGQSSLEYLLIVGGAILVVGVALSVLGGLGATGSNTANAAFEKASQTNIFNPANFLPPNSGGVPAVCGNGIKETGELCDGIDLGGQTCQSRGFDGGGTLQCKLDCSNFIVSECTSIPTPVTKVNFTVSSSDLTKGTTTPSGTIQVDQNSAQSITATPSESNSFGGWAILSGNDCTIDDSSAVSTTARIGTQACSVQANFGLTKTLSLNSNPSNGGTVKIGNGTASGNVIQNFIEGTATSITATRNPGNNFLGWVRTSGTCSPACSVASGVYSPAECTQQTINSVTMSDNCSYKADFEAQTYSLTINLKNAGSGTFNVVGVTGASDKTTYSLTAVSGSTVEVQANWAAGNVFKAWNVVTGDCTIADNSSITTVNIRTTNCSIELDMIPTTSAVVNYFTVEWGNSNDFAVDISDNAQAITAGGTRTLSFVKRTSSSDIFDSWQSDNSSCVISDSKTLTTNVTINASGCKITPLFFSLDNLKFYLSFDNQNGSGPIGSMAENPHSTSSSFLPPANGISYNVSPVTGIGYDAKFDLPQNYEAYAYTGNDPGPGNRYSCSWLYNDIYGAARQYIAHSWTPATSTSENWAEFYQGSPLIYSWRQATFEAWVKQLGGSDFILSQSQEGNSGADEMFEFSAHHLWVRTSGSVSGAGVSTPIRTLGDWHHVVGTWNWDASGNITLKYYVDGALISTTGPTSGITNLSYQGNGQTVSMAIGHQLWFASQNYTPARCRISFSNMELDELRVYNIVLTADQVLARCESSKPAGFTGC